MVSLQVATLAVMWAEEKAALMVLKSELSLAVKKAIEISERRLLAVADTCKGNSAIGNKDVNWF